MDRTESHDSKGRDMQWGQGILRRLGNLAASEGTLYNIRWALE